MEREPSKVELIDQTKEIVNTIRKRLHTTKSQQKIYAENRRRPLEINVGEHEFLKYPHLRAVFVLVKRKN